MDKKTIDNIVWWIPFKKLRNSIRNRLYNSQNKNLFFKRINNIFNLCKLYNLNIENFNDVNLKPILNNDIFDNKNFNNMTINDLIQYIKDAFDIEKLEESYYLLEDEYSKNMFVSQIIVRASKYDGLSLILYYSNSWKYYDDLCLAKTDKTIEINNSKLYLYDLSKLSFSKDIKLYYTQRQLFETYFLEQYRYKNKVMVEKDDYIIDGGGCYGDTALYFSYLSGEKGRVFSFEFVENNIEIFNTNLKLNTQLKDRIKLIENPLYNISNADLFISDEGPSSRINKDGNNIYKSISIDDFVISNNIEKIDFIKLDIEGAELDALKGAKETIVKYKPKLAICLYHQNSDFYNIPVYLKSIVPEYKFYFDHFTLNTWSSILFCKI